MMRYGASVATAAVVVLNFMPTPHGILICPFVRGVLIRSGMRSLKCTFVAQILHITIKESRSIRTIANIRRRWKCGSVYVFVVYYE